MNYQTILTTSCTDFTGCFSKRAIVQQYTSTILMEKKFLASRNIIFHSYVYINAEHSKKKAFLQMSKTDSFFE